MPSAWPVARALPSGADRWTVEAAVRWLAVVPRSQLAQRLARANRPGTNFSARAPWPRTVNGAGLLLLDLDDANGTDGLLEVVLGACADAVDKDIPDGWLFQTNMAMQHDWNLHADDPRLLTAAIAEHALVWPDADIVTGAPPRVGGADVTRLLRQTFAAHPAVVEGHR